MPDPRSLFQAPQLTRRTLLGAAGFGASGAAGLSVLGVSASPAMADVPATDGAPEFGFTSSLLLPFGQYRHFAHPWHTPLIPGEDHLRLDPGTLGDGAPPLLEDEGRSSGQPSTQTSGNKSAPLGAADTPDVPRGFKPVSLRYDPAPDQVLQADGTILHRRTDGKLIDHPTQSGGWFAKLKLSYEITRETGYLNAAIAQATRMRQLLKPANGALWATYDMPTSHKGVALPRPWVSAFGQQQVVQTMLGMHKLTGDTSWVRVAEQAFAAFTVPRDPANPGLWVTAKDEAGYLWFEGFPTTRGTPTMTYNIHLTALYGLAAMYPAPFSATHHEQVRALVHAGMATAAHYASAIRNPQQASFYYANPKVDPLTHKFYHAANAGAMWTIYDRTGYAPMAWWATALARDFPVHRGGGLVFIKAGTYTLRKVWDDDSDDGRTWQVTFKTDTRLKADSRQGARAGVAGANKHQRAWIRLAGGQAPGWWIHETPGRAFLEGFNVDRMDFAQPVEVFFEPGVRIRGVSKNARGFDVAGSEVYGQWKTQSSALVDTVSTVGGRQYVRVINGLFKGKWLNTGSSVHLGPTYLG
ncbi:D-glucuronyl C5-epimerase family protein [Propionibacteriaceae bacterium G1746]|uniref:D-glucuronyl C5-epimerase family protein n=1 Tax=Aestuariimicrobium sp. G57 TaxID=3418485 RepID=UPI003C20E02F